jgi:hypothetical protein
MADHGISHRPTEHPRVIRQFNQLDIASIPLFVKLPGSRESGVSNLPVESIDVLPTVLDVLGVSFRPSMDGCSVLGKSYRARPSKRIQFGDNLHVLPAEYPSGIGPEELPLLSSEVAARIKSLVGRQELIGRPLEDFSLGDPSEHRLVESPCSNPESLQQPHRGIKLLGGFDRRLPQHSLPTLVLAFDGTIVSVTRPYAGMAEYDCFLFLVPPEEHPRPVTTFAIYEVRPGEVPELRRVGHP